MGDMKARRDKKPPPFLLGKPPKPIALLYNEIPLLRFMQGEQIMASYRMSAVRKKGLLRQQLRGDQPPERSRSNKQGKRDQREKDDHNLFRIVFQHRPKPFSINKGIKVSLLYTKRGSHRTLAGDNICSILWGKALHRSD